MGASALQKDRDGLCFFGQVSAVISHDLKNVLAIINEDAGLLQDFSLMAAQGMELDPPRLVKLAEKIQGQVKRGDGIIKNMNRFAHSVDLPVCDVDFRELTTLVISLLTRMASRKCVTVTLKEGEQVNGKGDPFTIQMLIAKALEYSMDSAGRDGELCIELSTADGVNVLTISGLSAVIPEEQLAELESISVKAGGKPAYVRQDNILILNF
ncbi:HAMP domain-containing histidine kinase [Desulfovibrio sp. JC022]|uniref:HAMP domain-containing histidine kinase n=1 Tax=Desulfovibrio sp. JC022 TaxID=2593642 RepID=UPI0013D3DD8A|nr:HAMP domain-containing histidine kinase [Desulfovibrio sp. JC022]NDV21574.1 HAMP domain-containing histidine kinase [Desulfovibrio sp. JC022]